MNKLQISKFEDMERIEFHISYDAVTYDSDYHEDVSLDFFFNKLDDAQKFKESFPIWCNKNKLISEDFISNDRKNSKFNYVSFQDIQDIDISLFEFPLDELLIYDTGWFYINPNAKITKIIQLVKREIVG